MNGREYENLRTPYGKSIGRYCSYRKRGRYTALLSSSCIAAIGKHRLGRLGQSVWDEISLWTCGLFLETRLMKPHDISVDMYAPGRCGCCFTTNVNPQPIVHAFSLFRNLQHNEHLWFARNATVVSQKRFLEMVERCKAASSAGYVDVTCRSCRKTRLSMGQLKSIDAKIEMLTREREQLRLAILARSRWRAPNGSEIRFFQMTNAASQIKQLTK